MGEPLLDHHVGDLVGGGAHLVGSLQDLEDRVVDDEGLLPCLLGVVPLDLLGDVDEATGVDGVVGGVGDASRVEVVAVMRLSSLPLLASNMQAQKPFSLPIWP